MQRLFPNRIAKDKHIWHALLAKQDIRPTQNIETVYGLFDEDKLVATGALFHNIIKCVAIDDDYHGGSVFNTLMSHLMLEVFQHGFSACYVYTKASAKRAFTYLGFEEIAHVGEQLYFMENAQHGIKQYLAALSAHHVVAPRVAAIVMNANPFTNGHLYLVEKTARENDVVHVFVLSEDLSQFSAEVRLDLVHAGVAHLTNVKVHETGSYLVSAATFPSYFLPEETDLTQMQARLDARVFKQHIAPTLGITHRYVGSEPLSPTTAIYNQAMASEFAGTPKLIVVERKTAVDTVISASRVRQLLAEGNLKAIETIVPKTTYDYLQTLVDTGIS